MTRVDPAPSAALELLHGLLGGFVSGLVYLLVLCAGAVQAGRHGLAGVNAVGAWLVRWLQEASPQALDNVYPDATFGGLVVALLAGASLGALLAGLLVSLPEDQPVAWGGLAGLVSWAMARWSILPALDPVLLRTVDAKALLAAHVLAGLTLGLWLHAGRRSSAS